MIILYMFKVYTRRSKYTHTHPKSTPLLLFNRLPLLPPLLVACLGFIHYTDCVVIIILITTWLIKQMIFIYFVIISRVGGIFGRATHLTQLGSEGCVLAGSNQKKTNKTDFFFCCLRWGKSISWKLIEKKNSIFFHFFFTSTTSNTRSPCCIWIN